MADNTELPSGSGGDTIRTFQDATGVKWGAAVVCYATTVGDPDTLSIVTAANGLPVVQETGSTFAISAASLPLPTGAATAANQSTGNASLATIAGAVSGTEMQVDVLTMPTVTVTGSVTVSGTVAATQSGAWNITNISGTVSLPTGAATAANQTTIIGHVDGIETLLGTIDADTSSLAGCVGGSELQVDLVGSIPAGTNNIGDVDVVTQIGAGNFAQNQVSVSSTATSIASSRATRRRITIVNHGTTDVYIGPSGVTTGNGLLLKGIPGAAVTLYLTNQIYGIVSSGSQSVSYMEEYD